MTYRSVYPSKRTLLLPLFNCVLFYKYFCNCPNRHFYNFLAFKRILTLKHNSFRKTILLHVYQIRRIVLGKVGGGGRQHLPLKVKEKRDKNRLISIISLSVSKSRYVYTKKNHKYNVCFIRMF